MIMGKYSLLFFIVCFLFFIPGFSSAQVKITLDSCIARALESNYSIKIIRNQQRQAENNLKLISAYMSKYINDIDNITKAPYYHSYFQSKSSFRLSVSMLPRNNRLPIVKWSPTEKTEGPIIPVRML